MKVSLISFFRLFILCILVFTLITPWSAADVSKEIVTEYENTYVNRAMFLKTPIRGDRQTIFLRGGNIIPDPSNSGRPLSFLVGEQVRITELKFRNNSIEFTVAAIDGSKKGLLVFQFPGQLEFNFPERENFDRALNNSLIAGLSYQEIESAKKEFIQDEFRRVTQDIARTTSSDNTFVMDAIATEIPEVADAIRSREQAEKELEELRSRYAGVEAERNRLDEQVRELNSNLNREQQEARRILNERDSLARKETEQQQELRSLRNENSTIRKQLTAIASEMDIQLGSNSELSGQVDSLSKNLQNLRDEWGALQKKMESTEAELAKIKEERNRLTSDLSVSRRKASQLESQLNSLTSNRDSLEATYVRTKNQLDNLELALKTSNSVSLVRMKENSGEQKGALRYEVNLLSKRIGTFSVRPPADITDRGEAAFTVDSPDTVQFSEEERIMFASLGKEIRIRAFWTAMGGSLESSLVEGEELQAAAPRETAAWAWNFSGSPDSGQMALLRVSFLDQNDNVIPVTDLEFEISPKSIIPLNIKGSFWIPALIGFILGSLLMAVLIRLTGRSSNGKPRKGTSRRDPSSYSTQKNL